jgi:hypothetical protein
MGRADGRGSSISAGRTALALAVVAAGLGLAAAAGSVANGGGTTASSGDAAVFGVIGLVVTAGAVAVVLRALRHTITPSIRRLSGAAAIVIVTLGGLTALASAPSDPAAIPIDDDAERVGETSDGDGDSAGAGRLPAARERDRNNLQLGDLEGTIYLTIALGLLVWAIIVFARRSELRAVEQAPVYLAASSIDVDGDVSDDDVADALRVSLAQLEHSDDPRIAIRAAYATLLERLAAIGLGRRSYEAPEEYIGRCLAGRDLPERPIRELLELFSLARFSRHEITSADADAARAAMRDSIDALTAVPA